MSKMNLTGKNNGWILCPSKSFPGKFYYFNVVNGEAVWSMNEAEKINSIKVNQFHKIPDKSHSYPEPDTPPIECPEITTTDTGQHSNNNVPITNTPNVQQLPIYGQTVFPKYVPNIESCIPSIIWMPIQYPNQVCVPETKRSMADQITQTSDAHILVHTCGPCCQRFVNYEKPLLNFDKQNNILNKDTYTYFVNSIQNDEDSVLNSNIKTSTPIKKPFQIQNGVPNSKIRKPVLNLETDSNVLNVGNGYTSLMPFNKVENGNTHNVNLLLGDNDLRHRLMSSAWRKNIVDPTDSFAKKNTGFVHETLKKKVSIDLSNLLDKDTCSLTNDSTAIMPNTSTANHMDLVPETTAGNRSVWYIVVDTQVWLEDHEFIDNIVLSDIKCKLLIPHAVRIDIETLSQGECRGQRRVVTARQLARRCATPPPHYVVEPATSSPVGSLFTTDSILECCLDAINNNYQVIIISNDPRLHIKAKSNNIPCYKVDDVKSTDINLQADLDFKKFKITIFQDSEGVYNETESVGDTTEIAVDTDRTQLFKNNNPTIDRCASKKEQHSLKNDSDATNNVKELNNLYKEGENHVSNISVTILNCVPNSNKSIEDNEEGGSTRTIQNSNVEFEFRGPVSKPNCQNNVFQFEKSVPNSINNNAFLFFQNAAVKYANTQCVDFKKPNTINTTFLKPNNTQIDNNITTKITETTSLQNNDPIVSFPLKNNINSNFKFNQSYLKTPPSFHFQKQTKDSMERMPSLEEQIKYIDTELKTYSVKSKLVDDIIQNRTKEWICSYVQIMENVLNYILQLSEYSQNKLLPPWTLREAITSLQMVYKCDSVTMYLLKKYTECLNNASSKKGKLNVHKKSNDFLKLVGCGILLIQHLKNIHPDNQHLVDAEKNLNLLLATIEWPFGALDGTEYNTELNIDDDESDMLKTPGVCRSEMKEEKGIRSNFIKTPSSVIDYLKKHYKEWESYVFKENKLSTQPPETKVVRTFGKNLNMVTIDKNKSISLLKTTIDNHNNDGPKTIRSLNNKKPVERSAAKSMTSKSINNTEFRGDEPNVMKQSHNDQYNKRSDTLNSKYVNNKQAEPKTVKLSQHDQPISKCDETDDFKCTSGVRNTRNAEPKLMKLSKIENAEPKVMINTKSTLDLDVLDYSETNDSVSDKSKSNYDIISMSCASYFETYTDNKLKNDNSNYNPTENYNMNSNNENIINQNINDNSSNEFPRNDSYGDSGFENDSTYAHSLVKVFFNELSDSFNIVHNFINDCIQEINYDTTEERKKILYDKAARSLEHVGVMIQQMKSIISRELEDTSALKTLLLGAGIEASGDKRISRYRQFVTKCVEQAGILHSALKVIVCLTGDGEYVSTSSDSTNHGYFNVFDISS